MDQSRRRRVEKGKVDAMTDSEKRQAFLGLLLWYGAAATGGDRLETDQTITGERNPCGQEVEFRLLHS